MPMPALSYTSYALLQNALAEFGFENLSTFYATAFADTYDQVKWKAVYSLGEGSISGTYTQIKSTKGLPVMARFVAFDGEAPKMANEGFTMSAGDMPHMKLGFDLNSKSMKETMLIAAMGAAVPLGPIFDKFTTDNAKMIGGVHSLINYAGFQIESTGAYTSTQVNNGGGVVGLNFDFGVPAAHKKLAGGYGSHGTKYAWSSDIANPIGDLQDMVKFADDNFIPAGVFRMNKGTWQTLRDHANTKKAVAIYLTGGSIASTNLTAYPVMEAQVRAYLSGLGLPPVEIVDEISAVEVYDTATRTMKRKQLHGFADNVVLLRPAGPVGTLQYQIPSLDFATPSDPAFVIENGLMRVSKYTEPKKESVEFVASATAIPVLDMPDYMLYLDISQAAS